MAEIVVDQLTEAAAQLSAQEVELASQLEALRDKIKGIQTVIDMFGNGNGAAPASAPVAAPVEEAVAEPVAEEAPAPKRRGRPKKSATAPKAKATKAKATKKETKTTKAKTTAKTTAKKPGRGRSAKWQSYIRDEYSSTPLPDVVANVLKAKPKDVFKIAAVMEELFPAEKMPKTDFLKARNRVSNILSAGARSGEWHRGRGGTYSCTKKSVA